jgi:hypothetical protein
LRLIARPEKVNPGAKVTVMVLPPLNAASETNPTVQLVLAPATMEVPLKETADMPLMVTPVAGWTAACPVVETEKLAAG